MTEQRKVYKIEVMVIDHDGIGYESIKSAIEDTRYPNHCIMPKVKGGKFVAIDWHDQHPLNLTHKSDDEYRRLFHDR